MISRLVKIFTVRRVMIEVLLQDSFYFSKFGGVSVAFVVLFLVRKWGFLRKYYFVNYSYFLMFKSNHC
jgi:hypothetical protein